MTPYKAVTIPVDPMPQPAFIMDDMPQPVFMKDDIPPSVFRPYHDNVDRTQPGYSAVEAHMPHHQPYTQVSRLTHRHLYIMLVLHYTMLQDQANANKYALYDLLYKRKKSIE